jgi:ureidoglycolate hydrolase
MSIAVADLTEETLAGIGRMLTPSAWTPPEPGAEHSYVDTLEDLHLEAPCSAGVVECARRPMSVHRMERHRGTREALVCLEGEAIVCLAPPQQAAGKDLQGIIAGKVRCGQAFILDTGAWHSIPFPVGKKTARFLVIFRSGTGRNDLEYHDFPESHSLAV